MVPGVGNFGFVVQQLRQEGWLEVIKQRCFKNLPTVGICVGFQIMCAGSEENTQYKGINFFPTLVKRLKVPRVPVIGFKKFQIKYNYGEDENKRFYFTHSFGVLCKDIKGKDLSIGYYQESGVDIIAFLRCKNIVGMQFHPEKSGTEGINFLSKIICSLEEKNG